MATENFTRTETISLVEWTGSNLNEIVTFAGSANLSYVNGVLAIHGATVVVTNVVVKNEDGSFREVTTRAKIADDEFTEV
jgi:hypothetical protein